VKGMSAFATFALTTAVLGLMIGLALRSGYAQGVDGSTADASRAFLPVVGLTNGHSGLVHVVNLTSDPTSPSVRFTVTFLDANGAAVQPSQACDLRAGQTCTVALTSDQCGAPDLGRARCEFRTVVDTQQPPQPPPTTDGGQPSTGGSWTTNIEVIDRQGNSTGLAGPLAVMAIPVVSIGTDGGVISPGGGTDGGLTGR